VASKKRAAMLPAGESGAKFYPCVIGRTALLRR
jgi:hypothetical protein